MGNLAQQHNHNWCERFMFKAAQSSISYDVKNWKNIGSKALNDDSPYDQVI